MLQIKILRLKFHILLWFLSFNVRLVSHESSKKCECSTTTTKQQQDCNNSPYDTKSSTQKSLTTLHLPIVPIHSMRTSTFSNNPSSISTKPQSLNGNKVGVNFKDLAFIKNHLHTQEYQGYFKTYKRKTDLKYARINLLYFQNQSIFSLILL